MAELQYRVFEVDGMQVFELPTERGALSRLPTININGVTLPNSILSDVVIMACGDSIEDVKYEFKHKYISFLREIKAQMTNKKFIVIQRTRKFDTLWYDAFGHRRLIMEAIFSLGGFWTDIEQGDHRLAGN